MPRRRHRHAVDIRLPADQSLRFNREFVDLIKDISSEGGFANAYLASEVFSKFTDPKLFSPADRGTAAVRKWQLAESRNMQTNIRLYTLMTRDCEGLGWISIDRLVREVRRFISHILGPLDYPACLMQVQITNGASTTTRRSPTAAVEKLTGEIALSESSLKHWFAMASGSRLSRLPIIIDDSSTLFTVPKKSDIDRVCCKEPSGNMLLQRSLGLTIAKRLKRFGIDLTDQSRNQLLARDALKLGLATIDLSSASDLISRQVVTSLLPNDWSAILDDLRVKSTRVNGKIHELEMFSSMGNGFTFELESLLFFAITKVVMRLSGERGIVSVFGDDIICPTSIVGRLDRVLSWFGFVLNRKKTHSTGFFRESCGHHYYKGQNVTPFYLKKAVHTLPELINTLNHLLEWDGRGWGCFTTETTYKFWCRWRNTIPKRLWGGIDPSDPTALVTGHPPRMRLVPITEALACNEGARLLVWLLRREHSNEDVVVDPQLEVGFKATSVVSCGERSTWYPGIAFGGYSGP